VRRVCYRHQRTLARPAEVVGVGYLTGANVRLRFLPAPAGTGVVFVRTDLAARPEIPACLGQVTGTNRRTTLGYAPRQVSLVEHVLAALSGLRIDNCHVELDAPEPPGLDGSAGHFVAAILGAGACLQPARRAVWTVERTILVRQPGAVLAIHPWTGADLKISYHLDYGVRSPLDRQRHTEVITPPSFAHALAGCRTFLLEAEAAELRRQGLGKRTQMTDLVVFGPSGPIDNPLRFANEPARHKILDVIGDLSLLNEDVRGHVVAYRSGHPLNVELARTLAVEFPGSSRRAA
jgi:UDP-3-O-acyl N-acetylglucosamine deacetylase